MKRLLRTCLLAAAFTYFGPIYGGLAYSAECEKESEAEFRQRAAVLNPRYVVATRPALGKLVNFLNNVTARSGEPPLVADRLLVDYRGDAVGYVFVNRGCVVPKWIGLVPIGKWAGLIESAGVDPDDFVIEYNV